MFTHKRYEDQMRMIWSYDYEVMKWSMFVTGAFCGVIGTGFVLLMLGLWSTSN